ncbi:MAG: hypothetical protein Q8908_06895, partial [Bacteroidota bacterium]|nr:hypothetical protein [Bacteroidota bacterium]
VHVSLLFRTCLVRVSYYRARQVRDRYETRTRLVRDRGKLYTLYIPVIYQYPLKKDNLENVQIKVSKFKGEYSIKCRSTLFLGNSHYSLHFIVPKQA